MVSSVCHHLKTLIRISSLSFYLQDKTDSFMWYWTIQYLFCFLLPLWLQDLVLSPSTSDCNYDSLSSEHNIIGHGQQKFHPHPFCVCSPVISCASTVMAGKSPSLIEISFRWATTLCFFFKLSIWKWLCNFYSDCVIDACSKDEKSWWRK